MDRLANWPEGNPKWVADGQVVPLPADFCVMSTDDLSPRGRESSSRTRWLSLSSSLFSPQGCSRLNGKLRWKVRSGRHYGERSTHYTAVVLRPFLVAGSIFESATMLDFQYFPQVYLVIFFKCAWLVFPAEVVLGALDEFSLGTFQSILVDRSGDRSDHCRHVDYSGHAPTTRPEHG